MIKHTHQIELIRFAKEHDYIITPLGWEYDNFDKSYNVITEIFKLPSSF